MKVPRSPSSSGRKRRFNARDEIGHPTGLLNQVKNLFELPQLIVVSELARKEAGAWSLVELLFEAR